MTFFVFILLFGTLFEKMHKNLSQYVASCTIKAFKILHRKSSYLKYNSLKDIKLLGNYVKII